MTWGRWLREQTDPLGLKRGELAEFLGVQQSSLSHYLNDGQWPDLRNLIAIVDALDVSIDRDILPHLREDLAHRQADQAERAALKRQVLSRTEAAFRDMGRDLAAAKSARGLSPADVGKTRANRPSPAPEDEPQT